MTCGISFAATTMTRTIQAVGRSISQPSPSTMISEKTSPINAPCRQIFLILLLDQYPPNPSPPPYQYPRLLKGKIRLMYLIRKTGKGKSLVIMGLALASDGIIAAMVLLHGLGTDQANKSIMLTNSARATMPNLSVEAARVKYQVAQDSCLARKHCR